MQRLPLLFATALLEATLISLPLLALGLVGVPWVGVVALVLLSALGDVLVDRWLPEDRRRMGRILGMLALALGALAIVWGGVGVVLAALVPSSPRFFGAYGTLLEALFACWRGSGLRGHSGQSIARTFSLGVLLTIVALLLGALVPHPDEASRTAAITFQIVLAVAAGLLAQALGHEEDEIEGEPRRWSWRWVATLGGAIGVVVLAALGLAAFFGGGGSVVLEWLWAAILVVIVVVLSPLLWLLSVLVTWLISLAPGGRGLRLPPALLGESPLQAWASGVQPDGLPPWLEGLMTFTISLLPLVLLVLLIAFARRRRRQNVDNEERESLLSAQVLGDDLLGLLGRLRNPFARRLEGLAAVLASLTGRDPASRIRRAYVRMLLILEQRGLPRPAAATPAEYAPGASAALAATEGSVAALTAAYERARYRPSGATPADADAADRALGQIEARPGGDT